MDLFANIIGNVGVICFLGGFFLLQREKLRHDDLAYLLLNLAGAVLLMGSLLIHWNLSAFLLEAAWALISMYGITQSLKKRKRR
ncbi:MAG: hypothetical protein K2Q01_06670 [Rickettsiales bacterium]|nr:hypothetical protein [Rickettsiales bacterium]